MNKAIALAFIVCIMAAVPIHAGASASMIPIMAATTAAVVINEQNELAASQDTNGCTPPINFSIEHDCTLRKSSSYSVNDYDCGEYYIKGDCRGNTISVDDRSIVFPPVLQGLIAVLVLGAIVVILLITITGGQSKW